MTPVKQPPEKVEAKIDERTKRIKLDENWEVFTLGQTLEQAKVPIWDSSSESESRSPPICAPGNYHLLKSTPKSKEKKTLIPAPK